MKTNANIEQLEKALEAVNKRYKGNVKFKRLEPNGRRVNFTLTVKSAKDPGGRRGFSGKRVAAACWHVHGHFFEELFKINSEAWISSGGSKITKERGNWQDRNIGSMIKPLYYSEACDCD